MRNQRNVFARKHILAGFTGIAGVIALAAAAMLLQRRSRRPEPGPRLILTIPNFGQVQLATPEAREEAERIERMAQMVRAWKAGGKVKR